MTSTSRRQVKALLQKVHIVPPLLLLLLLLMQNLLNRNLSLGCLQLQQLHHQFLAFQCLIQVLQTKEKECNLLNNLISHPHFNHIMLRQLFLLKEQGQHHLLPPRDLIKQLGFLLLLPE